MYTKANIESTSKLHIAFYILSKNSTDLYNSQNITIHRSIKRANIMTVLQLGLTQ
ncbi:hypothetical protein CHRYSEOSP005_04740 [Chryseobacterium sp. Alg-005]